jgi:outer membrane protein assembly factor BamA
VKATTYITIVALVLVSQCFALDGSEQDTSIVNNDRSAFEYFPFVLYDTDIGFGGGAKFFLFDQFEEQESLDLLLFASTKGERWARFVFSLPDIDTRHGTDFGWAFDFIFDYDLMIKYSFYGIGPGSKFDDREYYSMEPIDIKAVLSRSINEELSLSMTLRHYIVRNYNFEKNSILKGLEPNLNDGVARASSYIIKGVWDERDNFLNPRQGQVVEASLEHCPNISISNVSYLKLSLSAMKYFPLYFLHSVIAIRLMTENIDGADLPVQMMIPLGGNRTLRGFPQARFIGKSVVIGNVEWRFPIWWKFHGVFGLDFGRVAENYEKLGIGNWAGAGALGLRFIFDNFIIRLDTGISDHYFGLYFNINHIF